MFIVKYIFHSDVRNMLPYNSEAYANEDLARNRMQELAKMNTVMDVFIVCEAN